MSLSFFQKLALKKFVKNYTVALPFSLSDAEKIGFSAWFLSTSMKYFLARPYFNLPDKTRYFDALKEAVQRSNYLFSACIQQDEDVVIELNKLTEDLIQGTKNETIRELLLVEANELPYFASAIETKNRITRAFNAYKKISFSEKDFP